VTTLVTAPALVRTKRDWLLPAALGMVAGHLALVTLSVGLRADHVLVGAVLVGLAALGRRSDRVRGSALVLLPFWLTGVAYEAVHLLLPWRGAIHVGDLQAAELHLFGVEGADGGLQTISAALQGYTHPALDVLTGAAYIAYLLVPAGLVLAWVWRRDGARASRVAWAFLAVNLVGFAIQLRWPAAPPWYVDQYGLGPAVLDAAPSAAGAARFDAALGISYFAGFYSRNVNVFGAMPSLHAAYPVLAAIASYRLGPRWFVPTAAFAVLVGFSALYLNHHYLLDVLAGATLAALVYALVAALQRRFVTGGA